MGLIGDALVLFFFSLPKSKKFQPVAMESS